MQPLMLYNIKDVFPFPFDGTDIGRTLNRLFLTDVAEAQQIAGWNVIELQGFSIVVPNIEMDYTVTNGNNHYSGTMDAKTLGASLTVMMFNHMIWDAYHSGFDTDDVTIKFYALKDAMLDAPEINTTEFLSYID